MIWMTKFDWYMYCYHQTVRIRKERGSCDLLVKKLVGHHQGNHCDSKFTAGLSGSKSLRGSLKARIMSVNQEKEKSHLGSYR
jgi:hypothetical protein